ncbi:MAG: hypothetical protein DI527_00520 [Chelatococcus sp.]|nr:MAG: hypothetical protein DI527_00520 [Chelatococcus sp.]
MTDFEPKLPRQTPAERKAFLIYYARVLIREARARRGTSFSTTLLEWAGKARREAAEIDVSPPQMDLFG